MRRYLANYTIPSDENQMRFAAVHKFLRPDPSERKSKAHDLSLQTLLGLGNKQNGRKQGERGGDKILPLLGWIVLFSGSDRHARKFAPVSESSLNDDASRDYTMRRQRLS